MDFSETPDFRQRTGHVETKMIVRHFRIKVNGKAYDVEVEDIDQGGTTPTASTKPAAGGAPALRPPPTSAGQPTPRPAAAAPIASSQPPTTGPGWVVCPMAGKVQKIPVTVGQAVSAETVIAILEAMKMETSVCAGQKGTVSEIAATEGAVVDSGAPLVRIT